MKRVLLGIALCLALIGCSDKDDTAAANKTAGTAGDAAAGKALAEQECKGCHGLDGKGVAPGIPHLAGQSDRYILASLKEYIDKKRSHAALRQIAEHMSEADARNVAAYYASLPPVAPVAGLSVFSPYDRGQSLAPACVNCHGENGNSKTPGTPSLAGQQPRYLVAATTEYLNGARATSPMHGLVRDLTRIDLESLALYFASQTPAERPKPAAGNAAAAETKAAFCGGCHGPQGVSIDAATPNLAGQDTEYLASSIKAYRIARKHPAMQRAVAGLSDADIDNLAAFYTVQKSRPAENGQTLVRDLTDKCNRCHGSGARETVVAVPNLRAQDMDYLVMALRSYRDDRRQSSVMHNMSFPYGDAIVESIATFYAGQPAK
jgi:cytochrome c553